MWWTRLTGFEILCIALLAERIVYTKLTWIVIWCLKRFIMPPISVRAALIMNGVLGLPENGTADL